VGASGSTLPVTVTASNVTWTATSDATWLTLSQPSGTANATVTLTYATNDNTANRSAKVKFSGPNVADKTVTVIQAGKVTTPTSGGFLSTRHVVATLENTADAATWDSDRPKLQAMRNAGHVDALYLSIVDHEIRSVYNSNGMSIVDAACLWAKQNDMKVIIQIVPGRRNDDDNLRLPDRTDTYPAAHIQENYGGQKYRDPGSMAQGSFASDAYRTYSDNFCKWVVNHLQNKEYWDAIAAFTVSYSEAKETGYSVGGFDDSFSPTRQYFAVYGYEPVSRARFKTWLSAKFGGNIANLNAIHPGLNYTSFDEIELARPATAWGDQDRQGFRQELLQAVFGGPIGQLWGEYRLAMLAETLRDNVAAIRTLAPDLPIGPDFGTTSDPQCAQAATYNPTKICATANVNFVKVNGGPGDGAGGAPGGAGGWTFQADYSTPAGLSYATECDGTRGVTSSNVNERIGQYRKQVEQSFRAGANFITLRNFANIPNDSPSKVRDQLMTQLNLSQYIGQPVSQRAVATTVAIESRNMLLVGIQETDAYTRWDLATRLLNFDSATDSPRGRAVMSFSF
jgi:Viral BACON domain